MRGLTRARTVAVILAAAAGTVSVHACSPDAPQGGLPTHPTDGFSVSLEWDPPTVDAVGRPLTDLAGYRLYYSPALPPTGPEGASVKVGLSPSATVNGLPAGTYYFAVTAVDSAGNESDLSTALAVEVGR